MRVMLFHPPGELSLERLRTFGSMRAYYLEQEFRKLGVEMVFSPWMRGTKLTTEELVRYHEGLDISGIDHFIGHGVRYWSFLPFEAGEALRSRLGRHQCMAQIHDFTLLDRSPADVTFTHSDRRDEYPPGSRNHEVYVRHTEPVGWAADGKLCRSEQSADELRILVDHPTYGYNSRDLTLSILLNLRELVGSPHLWQDRYKSIRIRQLLDGEVVDLDVTGDLCVRPFKREPIPYLEMCREYSQAHIFCVTHAESLGQAVIEAATAGALIVTPQNCIISDRLATVRHYEWSEYIHWNQVLPLVDPRLCRKVAVQNSWASVAETMVRYLERFDRETMGWPAQHQTGSMT